MYSCVLWSGSSLPLPKINNANLAHDDIWVPLLASKADIPLFWWFLVERFNCFWLDDGSPIFIVDRASALVKAQERYVTMEEVLLPIQRQAWLEFYGRIRDCQGEVFCIQLPQLWHRRFLSKSEHFNIYMKKFLLPLECGIFDTRRKQEQKRLSMAAHFERVGAKHRELYGEKPALS